MAFSMSNAPKKTTSVVPRTGASAITSFFTLPPPPPPGPGRPPRSNETRGRPPSITPTRAAGEASTSAAPVRVPQWTPSATVKEVSPANTVEARPRGSKKSRIDWSEGEGLNRITDAVTHWLANSGSVLAADKDISLVHYAAKVAIPFETLRKYVCKDESKRRVLGSSSGKPKLLSADVSQFAVDAMRRRDRANDGLTKLECLDMLSTLEPDLSRPQLRRSLVDGSRILRITYSTYITYTLTTLTFPTYSCRPGPSALWS